MTLIQIILLALLLVLAIMLVWSFQRKQLTLIAVVGYGLFIVGGVAVVLFPSVASTVARIMGVGRGTDAIVYVLNVLVLVMIVRMHVRQEKLDFVITQLVRDMAYETYKKEYDSSR